MTGRKNKNTVYNLCKRSISLPDLEGHLMGLILHKESSTNSASMVNTCDFCYQCDDVKITRIEFNNFCNWNTVYMLCYTKEVHDGNIQRAFGHVPMDATC